MAGKNDDKKQDLLSKFSIDDDDVRILQLFQEKPNITHVEIAERIRKSQPAVGARVTKLERKDLLSTQKGVNFKKIKDDMYLLLVEMQTRDPISILDGELRSCPFVINAFKKSGTKNIVVLLASTNMEKLEGIIDRHFRSNPDVISVETSFIVDMVKDLILPLDWEFLKYEDIPCGEICCKTLKKRIHGEATY